MHARTLSRAPTRRRSVLARALVATALAAPIGVLAFGTTAGATASPTLYVSKTGHDTGTCRLTKDACATITYALGEAPAGATISVGTGTFAEQLTLAKNVTIKGAGKTSTIIEPTTVTTAATDPDSPGTPQAVVVYVEPGVTANLQKLEVNGSALTGYTPGSTDLLGIFYRDASGTVSSVLVNDIQQPPADFGDQPGANGGIYVASDGGTTSPSDVTMTGVTVTNYDKNGITCDDIGTVCDISGSTVTGSGPLDDQAQNGIQVWGATADISTTTVSADSYTAGSYTASGILVINPAGFTMYKDTVKSSDDDVYTMWYPVWGLVPATPRAVSVSDSTIETATNNTAGLEPFGSGWGEGLVFDGINGETVTGNTIESNAENGIGLYDSINALISANTVKSNAGDGIYVGDTDYTANFGLSTDDTIESNALKSNGIDGIYADVVANDAANTFADNASARNVRYDYEDVSTGSDTAGTANLWSGNTCTPAADSSPEALC